MLDKRKLVIIALAGVIAALLGMSSVLIAQSVTPNRYRAETQVALVPSRQAPVQEISSLWEALSRGQAGVIGAEVLGQRRWLAPASAASGVPVGALTLAAGPVANTTLINVSVEAPSAWAAEAAVDAVVREGRPVVEQVSGPFALEVVQDAAGSATEVGATGGQAVAFAGAAGLLIGGGSTLLVTRRRAKLAAAPRAPDTADGGLPRWSAEGQEPSTSPFLQNPERPASARGGGRRTGAPEKAM